MRPIRSVFALVAAASTLAGASRAEEGPAAKKLTLVAPMNEGVNITGINGRGDVVGFHWEPENGNPDILYEAPFFAKGAEVARLPLLKTYTATFPAAVSDDGLVVGRASKPGAPNAFVYLRNQAFVWTAAKGIQGLGAPEGDGASIATGVSRDGRRISGIGVGDYRLRGLLWEREGDGWKSVVLPDAGQLGSNVLAISPDGRRLAAVQKGETSLWTEAEPGVWKREGLAGEEKVLIPRGVNDAGLVVGFRNDPDGRLHAMVWGREGGVKSLETPPGFEHSQASAVNNAGDVVGQIDGPHGQLPGPRAFLYRDGKLRIIDECGPDFVWATAVNDQGQVAGVLEKEEEEVHADPAKADPAKKP
ncbi:HAF repeat-containing protein [Paludisphaera mucosa]|uniref:HAF repeat-containing protein n=1 Tax=Paludisphaera mucosa TaxID=3030827 RepID=A0ABT6FEP9_9BACT|nr:HAF repeat-containing protein [Paludisphaera mucosa]MDG3006046.1 HAF repeat-containing protein [Paludisphaera mucosa]